METAGPTASRLHQEVVAKWAFGQEHELVSEINGLTGVVLVFWEHKAIAKTIIPLLRGDQRLPWSQPWAKTIARSPAPDTTTLLRSKTSIMPFSQRDWRDTAYWTGGQGRVK